MKLKQLYLTLILLVLIPCTYVNAQENITNSKFQEKLDELEVNILKYDNKIDKSYNELYKSFLDLKKQWSDEIIVLEAKKKDVDKTLACIIIISVLLGITSILKLFKEMKKRVDNKIEESLEKHIKLGKDELIKLVQGQQIETKLMNEKKILVVSEDLESMSSISPIMNVFTNKDYYSTKDIDKSIYSEYDLILFNCVSEQFIKECIEDTIINSSLVYVCYINNGIRISNEVMALTEKINCANSKIQLYQNMMNSLKYQENILQNLP
ncbi:MAG: hypothetical protein N4A50_03825 [Vallitalea sp.]|jgi:hypothetical protein|nr:hypothetical protein [Vallitalea sp.]